MGTREAIIIGKARVTLNDVNEDNPRWSDERLYGLLDEAQEVFCKDIPLVRNNVVITTVGGQADYRLPEDCVKLLTAKSNGIPLDIISYDEIERDNPSWEDTTSSAFSHVVTNSLSQQIIRPYPLVDNSIQVKCNYQALPVKLGWDVIDKRIVEALTMNGMWDLGLRQYIISQAFLDYGDESSIQRSLTALGLFTKEFNRAEKLARKSFSKRSPTTAYQARVTPQGENYGRRSSRY